MFTAHVPLPILGIHAKLAIVQLYCMSFAINAKNFYSYTPSGKKKNKVMNEQMNEEC